MLKSRKISVTDMQKFSEFISARVLVVDDHPTTASTLARAIGQLGLGIEAIAATSAEQALEKVKDRPVDILITDMIMTGMNGLELVEKLQSCPASQPAYIIMITAYDLAGRRAIAQRLNVDEVILKPVHPERICQLVAAAIDNLNAAVSSNLPEAKPV